MDASSPFGAALFIPLFIGVFAVFWIGVCHLLGLLSGWKAMHRRFGGPPGPRPPGSSMISGRVGWASYKNVLSVAADPFGLYLSVMFMFRAGHPSIFIPWNEIGPPEPREFLWMRNIRFTVGQPTITAITLPLSCVRGTMLDAGPR